MNYNINRNPYKLNAAIRNRKAPINNLIKPQKFNTGGSVRALSEIMPTSLGEAGDIVDKGWETMSASADRTEARVRVQDKAEKKAKEIQKKNKKKWWEKAIETLITIANPVVGALYKGATTYQKSKAAHSAAEDAEKFFEGSFMEDTFADIEDQMYENKNSAAIYDIIGSLAMSELSNQFAPASGTEEIIKEGTTTFGGEVFDFAKDMGAATVGGVNPQLATLAASITRIPGLENVMTSVPGQVVTNTILQDLSQPDDPEVDFSAFDPYVKSGPTQTQLARNIQI